MSGGSSWLAGVKACFLLTEGPAPEATHRKIKISFSTMSRALTARLVDGRALTDRFGDRTETDMKLGNTLTVVLHHNDKNVIQTRNAVWSRALFG